MSLAAGTKLGPYEILAAIGAGGMGEVYKARDARLGRDVAIKISQDKFSDRFEREARSIAALNHPYICQLYDVGPDYLVMELIEGTNLKGPLPLEQALDYARQILSALDVAHSKGITHRDLKPANILVTKQGIKLLDFGLAKQSGPLKETDATQALTEHGAIIGTLNYMSPEQLQSKEVDERSDIFSFGVVFYEMVTGKRAFEGSSGASVIAAILERPAPSIAESAPLALDRVLRTCLAKDPNERWQSARDLKREFEWIANPAESAAPIAARRRNWRALAMLVAAILVTPTLAVLGTRWFTSQPAPLAAPRLKMTLEAPPGLRIQIPMLSPDGSRIALRTPTGVFIRPIDSLEVQPTAAGDGGVDAWSPDGKFLLWYSGSSTRELVKIPIAGGPPQTVATGLPLFRGATWNVDGTILYSQGGPVLRVSENGGTPTPVTTVMGWEPRMLPDRRHFLFLGGERGSGEEAIWMGSLDSKDIVKLTPATSKAELAPSGHLVFMRGTTLMAQAFDAAGGRVLGEAFPIANDVALFAPSRASMFSVAANGLIAYQGGGLGRRSLTWVDRSGKPSDVIDDGHLYDDVEISPDGKFLAVTRVDPKTLNPGVWITDLTRGVSSRLTPETDDIVSATWSPDGKRIAYSTAANKTYVRDASGASDRQEAGTGVQPAWTPDGASLIVGVPGFQEESARRPGLSQLSLADHWAADVFDGHFLQPMVSPDGRWIAYTSDESGTWEIFVQSLPAGKGKWQISTHGGVQPIWRRDGRELFYASSGSNSRRSSARASHKIFAVPVKTGNAFEAGVPLELFSLETGTVGVGYFRRYYAVSPDGQRFLMIAEVEAHAPAVLLQNWLTPAR